MSWLTLGRIAIFHLETHMGRRFWVFGHTLNCQKKTTKRLEMWVIEEMAVWSARCGMRAGGALHQQVA